MTDYCNQVNVLVVDDDEKVCRLIKTFLEEIPVFNNVTTATNVSMALLKLKNDDFHLIITDYNMPNKTGSEFINLLKMNYKTKKIKILLISGYLNNSTIKDVIDSGAKNILIKPNEKNSYPLSKSSQA